MTRRRLAALLVLSLAPFASADSQFAVPSDLTGAMKRLKSECAAGQGACSQRPGTRLADVVAAPPGGFDFPTAAAIAWADHVRRRYSRLPIEHCSFIVRLPGGRFSLTPIVAGTRDACPDDGIGLETPPGSVASVHTHPVIYGGNDLSSEGQMFSEGDFNAAAIRKIDAYLSAPAGHVLHYKPGDSKCMSNNMVQHTYTVIRGGDIYSELPFKPNSVMKSGPQRQYCVTR